MKKRDDILTHLEYGLKHVDGLIWLCQLLIAEGRPNRIEVAFDGEPVITKTTLGFLQNPLAESGLIYCRKLLDFLGIKLDRKESKTLREVPNDRSGGDVGIEHLGLSRITIAELLAAGDGPSNKIEAACIHTIRAANKGVAHFTEDKGERAQAEEVVICARIVVELIQVKVYDVLGIARPTVQVWTAG